MSDTAAAAQAEPTAVSDATASPPAFAEAQPVAAEPAAAAPARSTTPEAQKRRPRSQSDASQHPPTSKPAAAAAADDDGSLRHARSAIVPRKGAAAAADDDGSLRATRSAIDIGAEESGPSGVFERPRRSKSFLARLGVAPIATYKPPTVKQFDPENVPERSPTGTIRLKGGSKLVRRPLKEVIEEPKGDAATAPESGVTQWHLLTVDQVFQTLGSTKVGLTSEKAAELVKTIGKNEITQPPRMSVVERFFRNFFSAFSLIMIVASILCFIITGINSGSGGELDVQTLALACVLIGVALISSTFQTAMENASDNLMEALHEMQADFAWVVRDGKLQQIACELLVPGDYVRVQLGEKVPADLRIVEASNLAVNNAPLTGEPKDIQLAVEAGHKSIVEAKNIARSGCSFTVGNGYGVVFATGDNTAFGKIAKAATSAEKPDTLMRREVSRLILIMAVIGLVFAISFGAAAGGTGQGWQAAIIIMVGLFVANIPEGLLPQITLSLTITANRMFERKVVVSNLEIIETLGAVSVICSDKTGTLTLNRMSVAHVVYDGIIHQTHMAPPEPDGTVLPEVDYEHPCIKAIQRCVALNSDAVFIEREGDDVFTWKVKGDASETALVKFTQWKTDVDAMRAANARLAVVPFHSSNKWMATVNRLAPRQHIVLMKGAGERVINRCSRVMTAAGVVDLTDEMKAELNNTVLKTLASKGERVFGFAEFASDGVDDDFVYNTSDEGRNFVLENMTLLGLASMIDPPRPSVPAAIQACHRAGIHVIMVTGDHPDTALAISRSLGLITKPVCTKDTPFEELKNYAAVVTGDDIVTFSQEDWDRALQCEEHVFARTQPEQKQMLVLHLAEKGAIVAMTGDGVNDAPALKAAHVGVAVGSGTSVAKEAAQIIITDDDFGSIVVGVREGRQIFDNLKKAVTFIVSHLGPELFPYIFNFAVPVPLAMETIVILLVDLGTDMLPGIALAYEEVEDRVMQLPPRTADDHLICPTMLVQGYLFTGIQEMFFAYWAFFWTFNDYGFTFKSLVGAGTGYRSKFSALNADQKTYYTGLCQGNAKYVGSNIGACSTPAAMESFMSYFNGVVSDAQAAYFVCFVAMQFANLVNRRHQTTSVFSPNQQFNYRMILAVLFSIGFMCFFIYVPVVNKAFYLGPVSSANACSGLWGIPVMILIEEIRKLCCRVWPEGVMARLTLY